MIRANPSEKLRFVRNSERRPQARVSERLSERLRVLQARKVAPGKGAHAGTARAGHHDHAVAQRRHPLGAVQGLHHGRALARQGPQRETAG